MLMTRLAFIFFGTAAIMTSSSPCFQFFSPGGKSSSVTIQQYQYPPLVAKYYEPPLPLDPSSGNYNNSDTQIITATRNNDDYYSNNPSVFGKILRGELPARTYLESTDLLAFCDRSPKALLHALIIPKRYVKTVYSLRSRKESYDNEAVSENYDFEEEEEDDDDIRLIQDLRQMGIELLQQQQPAALAADDFIFCFHIPPFNSVDHLHLHVLAPKSEMNWFYREIKYKCGMRWCTSDLDVIERLEAGLPAVSYKHPFQC